MSAQLVADSVVDSPDSITYGSPQNHPVLVGTSDVMLVARDGKHEGRDGGAAELRMKRIVDIWIRDQIPIDPGLDFKEWLRGTFKTADQIINSVGDDEWWPTDPDGNLLLIESAKLVGDSPPDFKSKGSVYGEYVCSIECTYFPAVNPAKNP